MKKILTIFLISCLSLTTFGQFITVDTAGLTPQQLVEDTLISGCVEAFNITYTGNPAGIGYFNATGTSFDSIMTSGIILASGEVTNAIGPNNSSGITTAWGGNGDSDLDGLITQGTNDASVLEFDFIPSSDTLNFKFVFGSDEYLEYVNSSFNDVFAFFLTGPNPSGGSYLTQNIAMIPGTTTPVSINNVNNASYSQYYIVNGTGSNPNNEAIQYDGYTVGLYATALVTPCETYHIKLAVADAGDSSLDSGVFIEAGSFTDGTAVSINNVNPAGTQNDLYEGCTSFYVFTRQDTTDTTDPVNIPLSYSGTATNGVDLTNFPTTITIPAGQISDTLVYTVFNDGIIENTEYFIIEILSGCPCNPSNASDTITLYDYQDFKASIINTDSMFCGMIAPPTYTLSATCVSHPDWFIDYTWNTGSTDTFITVIPPAPGYHSVYWCEIADICGNSITDTIIVGVSNITDLSISTTDALCYGVCNGTITSTMTSIGLTPGKFYKWSDIPGTTYSGDRNDLCTGNYTVTLTDNSYCEYVESFFIDQPSAVLSETSGIMPIDTTYCDNPGTLTLEAIANITDVTYSWNGAATSGYSENVVPFLGVNTYYVDISDFCGYTVTDTIHIYVSDMVSTQVYFDEPTCNQSCDGTIEVLSPDGIPPFIYQWGTNNSGNFTTAFNTLDSLCADTFTLNVIDFAGCDYQFDFIMEDPPVFDPAESYITNTDTMWCGITPPSTVQLEAICNIPDANYLWSTGETTQHINITPTQGTTIYSVTISDECGNAKTDYVNIIVSTMSGVNLSTQETVCYNSCDGEVNVIPIGGISPFTYNWSGGVGNTTSGFINTLCAGNYSVVITDNGGCEFTENFEITSPPPLNECMITNTDSMFCGVTAPTSITIETLVNTNVTYFWSTGSTNNSITFTPQTGANVYWVDFTDVCGNVYRDSMIFSVSNFSGANVLTSPATCFGDCDGGIVVTPLFGLTPYTFEWSLNGVGSTPVGILNNICAGQYSVTVSDLAECFVVKNFTIIQPDSITWDFQVQNSNGTDCDGFASVIPSSLNGGTPPFTYLWDDPNAQTTYNAHGLCPGLYTITVTDSEGCINNDTIRVLDLTSISSSEIAKMINIYPNPSTGDFVIELNELSSNITHVKVFDITGKELYLSRELTFNEGIIEINGIPRGVNILQIEFKDNKTVQKRLIVIE